jgi:hypothetical protein
MNYVTMRELDSLVSSAISEYQALPIDEPERANTVAVRRSRRRRSSRRRNHLSQDGE